SPLPASPTPGVPHHSDHHHFPVSSLSSLPHGHSDRRDSAAMGATKPAPAAR
uniref:Uncharacterized protein n=1 Tax=Aegilops tauschii subsp. strangulata TaxID=200361 RepID=A0A452XLP4_AEGTS